MNWSRIVGRKVRPRHAKQTMRRAIFPGTASKDRIEIVSDQIRPRIRDAKINVVVIPISVGQTRLAVVSQSVYGHVAHPLVHIGDGLNRREIVGIVGGGISRSDGVTLGEVLRERDQVGPVVFTGVGVLEIVDPIRGWVRQGRIGIVALIAKIRTTHAVLPLSPVEISRAVCGKMMIAKFGILRLVANIEPEGGGRNTGRWIRSIPSQLDGAGLSHCQSCLAINGAAHQLIRSVLGVEIEAVQAVPGSGVREAQIETLRQGSSAAVAPIPGAS